MKSIFWSERGKGELPDLALDVQELKIVQRFGPSTTNPDGSYKLFFKNEEPIVVPMANDSFKQLLQIWRHA